MISLLLLEAFGFAGKPASMSSVLTLRKITYVLKAAFANDGTPGYLDRDKKGSLAHTLHENKPWRIVDLGSVYCIWAVRILNRGTFATI